MDIGTVITWAGFALTIVLNLASLSFGTGVVLTRITNNEKQIDNLLEEIKAIRSLKEEMSSVQTKLGFIAETLIEVKQELARD